MPVKVEGGWPLTNRELEIALLAARGMRSVHIARLLFISTPTCGTSTSRQASRTGYSWSTGCWCTRRPRRRAREGVVAGAV
jgi:DNA-binding NarL/FixJ family response regulator